MRFEQGEWNAASEDVEAVLRSPRTPAITRIPALRTLAHLRVRRGDPDISGPVLEARSLAGPAPVPQRAGMLAVVCAEAAWLADDREGVIREVQPVYELTRRQRDPRMNGELAAWLWRMGALQEPPTNIAEPYATEISGDWRRAAEAWRALGCPYEHACLLAWHGTEADQRQALTILEQLGAAPAARSLRRQMRMRGVRRIPRGSRPSTLGHPLGLTRREAEILALLADGLRSSSIAKRLFVSPKTIEHHVSAILAKLGVSSRAEAVALAHRQTRKDPA
jgi:DNA-binding CsgD family transcriptional regulator